MKGILLIKFRYIISILLCLMFITPSFAQRRTYPAKRQLGSYTVKYESVPNGLIHEDKHGLQYCRNSFYLTVFHKDSLIVDNIEISNASCDILPDKASDYLLSHYSDMQVRLDTLLFITSMWIPDTDVGYDIIIKIPEDGNLSILPIASVMIDEEYFDLINSVSNIIAKEDFTAANDIIIKTFLTCQPDWFSIGFLKNKFNTFYALLCSYPQKAFDLIATLNKGEQKQLFKEVLYPLTDLDWLYLKSLINKKVEGHDELKQVFTDHIDYILSHENIYF